MIMYVIISGGGGYREKPEAVKTYGNYESILPGSFPPLPGAI